jgi:hypothetical protein
MPFMLRLRIQRLACFLGLAFNVLCPLLLDVGIHFSTFGGRLMLWVEDEKNKARQKGSEERTTAKNVKIVFSAERF